MSWKELDQAMAIETQRARVLDSVGAVPWGEGRTPFSICRFKQAFVSLRIEKEKTAAWL